MKATLKGKTLTITVELTEGHTSKSGKSTILYSSGGFKWSQDTGAQGVGISLNVIKSTKDEVTAQ